MTSNETIKRVIINYVSSDDKYFVVVNDRLVGSSTSFDLAMYMANQVIDKLLRREVELGYSQSTFYLGGCV